MKKAGEPRVSTPMPKSSNIFNFNHAKLAELIEENFVYKCDTVRHEEDPATYSEAMARADSIEWREAMGNEYKSLADNKTWTITELPPNKRAIKSKWVFKTKFDVNGALIKHKARLVAKGLTQEHNIDYFETFAPVVRYNSIRMLLAFVAAQNLHIWQMDVVTAYLQGYVDAEIYMELPEGFEKNNKVCKLHRSIYGLKQSGKMWNDKINAALKSFGLIRSKADPCIYINEFGNCNLC